MSTPAPLPKDTLVSLIRANHILHHYHAVDAFGHISIRHPLSPDHYVMAGYMAPALVSNASHLITYNIADSSPTDPNAPRGYSERFIHGEMFRRYPGVHSVIHSHALEVIPFAVAGVEGEGGVQLRAMFHMAGFLGSGARVWDIGNAYAERERNPEQYSNDVSGDARDGASASQDLLVRSAFLGTSLAAKFSDQKADTPEHTVTLMKRHGFTTWGSDVETAVFRTIYTMANAKVQLEAMTLRGLHPSHSGDNEGSSHASAAKARAIVDEMALTSHMTIDAKAMNERTQSKSWPLWIREVEVNPLYKLET